eukprot:2332931-Rhodomonas_salina.10
MGPMVMLFTEVTGSSAGGDESRSSTTPNAAERRLFERSSLVMLVSDGSCFVKADTPSGPMSLFERLMSVSVPRKAGTRSFIPCDSMWFLLTSRYRSPLSDASDPAKIFAPFGPMLLVEISR